MYALIVRIYSVILWFGLLVGFSVGYYIVKIGAQQLGPDGQSVHPFVGGLVGLFIAILILGVGFTLAGIYENTLATANALRRMGGQSGSTNPTAHDSTEKLQEALPLHAGHWIFVAGFLGFLVFMIYFGIQRFGP